MTSIEGLAAVTGPGTTPAGPAAERTGETDFAGLLHRAQFAGGADGASGVPASTPDAAPEAPGGPEAPGASEARTLTVRASDPSISERVGGRIETLNDSRLLERGAREAPGPPSARALGPGARPDGPTATLGAAGPGADPFDAAVRNLQGAFHHAIEVELVAKTGTSLNSSMNKLMSGN